MNDDEIQAHNDEVEKFASQLTEIFSLLCAYEEDFEELGLTSTFKDLDRLMDELIQLAHIE